MEGYIKLHRKMTEWEWYSDANTMRVFLHILLTANYRPSRYKGIEVGVGETVIGRKALAEKLGLSERQIRTALNHLKSTNEITIKSTNKFSVVRVENWAKWQLCDDEPTNKATNKESNKSPTSDQQVTTPKENKNTRKKENIIPPSVEMVREYCLERKNGIDPEDFCNFYESKGWMVGKNKMKNWQSAVRTWEKSRKDSAPVKQTIEPPKYKKFEPEPEVKAEPMTEKQRANMEELKKRLRGIG